MKKTPQKKLEKAVLLMRKMTNRGFSFTFAKFTALRKYKISAESSKSFQNLESYKSFKIEQQLKMRQNKRYVKV